MKVILTEPINQLGNLGDEIDIKNGFARNYLIPQGKAVRATKENRIEFEAKRGELEAQALALQSEANEKAQKLIDQTVTLTVKAIADGKLYGSIGTKQIADAITETLGVEVPKSAVRLNDGALHNIGQYNIAIQLHSNVWVTVIVDIVAEG